MCVCVHVNVCLFCKSKAVFVCSFSFYFYITTNPLTSLSSFIQSVVCNSIPKLGDKAEGVSGLKALGVRDLNYRMSFLACGVSTGGKKTSLSMVRICLSF